MINLLTLLLFYNFQNKSNILIGQNSKLIKEFDLYGNVINTYSIETGKLQPLIMSPNGSQVLSGSNNGQLRMFDSTTSHIFNTIEILKDQDSASKHNRVITSLDISSDGNNAVIGTQVGSAQLYSLTNDMISMVYAEQKGTVSAVKISPCGRYLLTGSFDHKIKMQNLETGELLKNQEVHFAPVIQVIFDPYMMQVISSDIEGRLIKTNIHTKAVIKIYGILNGKKLFSGTITKFDINSNGTQILTSYTNGKVVMYDFNTGYLLKEQSIDDKFKSNITDIKLNFLNDKFAVGLESGYVIVQDVDQVDQLSVISGLYPVKSVTWKEDQTFIADKISKKYNSGSSHNSGKSYYHINSIDNWSVKTLKKNTLFESQDIDVDELKTEESYLLEQLQGSN